jgi:hypothetical protein
LILREWAAWEQMNLQLGYFYVLLLMLFWCECNGKISFLDFQAYLWKE